MERQSNYNKELQEKVNKYQPSRDLELFCYALTSEQVKGNKLEAQRLTKVDKGKFYWAYKSSEEFRHWFAELCFSILGKNEAIPPYALLGAIIDKDVQAIRTYYELNGRLKNRIEHSGKVEGQETKIIIVYPQEIKEILQPQTNGNQIRINT